LLGSVRGHGCTFVNQLGLCIDLDPRIYRLGSSQADELGAARFRVLVPRYAPLGPLWLQALDVNDPERGAIVSNVLEVEIRE
jgi:hypothetical protein